MAEDIFIVGASRTPIGGYLGNLSSLPAPELGAAAIKSALGKAAVTPGQVDECIMGQVLSAGAGQAPARQAALAAGLPLSTHCMTINKVCGSGLKAVMLGADSIQLGRSHIVVAGGQENMSLAPHLLEKSRNGYRVGNVTVVDSMIKDGLWDPYDDFHMGKAAELCAAKYKFSRELQDAFARESYIRAQHAIASGVFNDEIVPVAVNAGKSVQWIEEDEDPAKANFQKMAGLRAAFEEGGTITAANASNLADGAAALVLASRSKVSDLGLRPLARIVAQASYSHESKWFTTAPLGAIKRCLEYADMSADDIDLYEINEAFSVVAMAAMQELGIPHYRVNVNGGAIALGHPLGASGARILTTLVHALRYRQKKYGLAVLCIGGGESVAVLVESC